MRIRFSEEEDFQNQAQLWEANVERSLKGRKGQIALRELEAALLALPEKKLIANELENAEGVVCSIGALAKYRNYPGSMALPKFVYDDHDIDDQDVITDEYEYEEAVETAMLKVAGDLGVPRLVAMTIIYQNDDGWYGSGSFTPEQRYDRMLRWVQRQIIKAA